MFSGISKKSTFDEEDAKSSGKPKNADTLEDQIGFVGNVHVMHTGCS